MFTPLLKLLPALRISQTLVRDLDHDQIAIDACISVVETYFPCDSIVAVNLTCLCEQYTWHVACYDNHASDPHSHSNFATATRRMHENCRAAGSVGAMTVEQKVAHERRQLNSLLNSVGGVVASFLTSQSVVPIPTDIPSIRLPSIAPPATPTPPKSTPIASQTTRPSPQSTMITTSSDASQSVSQPTSSTSTATASKSSSPSPSPGLIAGAVLGGVAVLALLGILIMLILRHKRKKRQTPLPTYHTPTGNNSARSLDETLVDRTPITEHRALPGRGRYGSDGVEKEVYQREEDVTMPRESELYTNANVWELDGREMTVRSELESPIVSPIASPVMRRDTPSSRAYAGYAGHDGRQLVQRPEHGELHF